ncbi:MAG TPA: 2-oxoglutarate dehydrogenase E1 component [Bacteroidales bacterium]|jgi:2-oxoglutarate dehydrogenase E1 component|nr:2-oxoglutarate dehydrogenase E1 component [Bacteroidales bacterium]
MDEFSFLGNSEIDSIDQLYIQYLKDPDSLDPSWRSFFSGFDFARKFQTKSESGSEQLDKEFRVLNYIDAFRKRGHLFTKTNPVRSRRQYFPTLDLENYNLSDSDLSTVFHAGTEIGIGNATLREIRDHMHQTYCQSVGVEYMFIRDPEKIEWLQNRMESNKNTTEFSKEDKLNIFDLLKKAVGFEIFIHRRFVGQKRFSLEGTETLIPALHYLITKGSDLGIEEFFFSMAHRGRLNVLANVIEKPFETIFQEFIAEEYDEAISLGDVKYHLGYCNEITLKNGKTVSLNLVPNPSHLESASPIIEGITRSHIDNKYSGDYSKVAPVIIHGDAAIAGQGVVYEVIQMSELPGYKTGGTIHIVINNQVGFTTNYLDARSSTYCTDIAKVIKVPIFHINGDDVEALLHTVLLAMDYRHTFKSDVFIDILSYRKYGHNEGDEPRYTQPTLYKAIAVHPNPRDIYADELLDQGVLTHEETEIKQREFELILDGKFNLSKGIGKVHIQRFLYDDWKGFKHAKRADFDKWYPNELTIDLLKFLGEKIAFLPPQEKFIDKTVKLNEDRRKMITDGKVDWSMAELLAYGSLLYDGHPVRLSGQDSVRGTFSQRHAAHVIEETDMMFIPLKHISPNQASFDIYNSPLNEYGVLGFEYGYALANSKGLTIWEAQYGDFINVAQVIIDQYISSAEEKWGVMNGIVLYLPHGYEGQGPEHSSARIERILLLAANNNMQIVNPTTPANFFHLLRQSIYRNFRVPLIIFTPKSLLRHPACTSTLDELAYGKYIEVIDDNDVDIEEVRRLVFCSGKIYYDLVARKKEFDARDIAIVRIEQLHPFPNEKVENIIRKYPNVLIKLWVQEEPGNMGPWRHIHHEFKGEIIPVYRQPSGSPAVGLLRLHQISQEEIISKVFRKCECELKRKYCGLQCSSGSVRQQILKQYSYFAEKIQ